MALRTVTMAELRLEVLLEAETYYRYRRRYLAAGIVTPVAESSGSGNSDTTRVRFRFDAFADRQS